MSDPTSFQPSFEPSSLNTLTTSPPVSFESKPPTFAPSLAPTLAPTLNPIFPPSLAPSLNPTFPPSLAPSLSPTFPPSLAPTLAPSLSQTFPPSPSPTSHPSSSEGTFYPSFLYIPSSSPTFFTSETYLPSFSPTLVHTSAPTIENVIPAETFIPSSVPTYVPSSNPTIFPTVRKETSEEYARRTYQEYDPSDITRFGKQFTFGEKISLPLSQKYISKTITVPLILSCLGFFFILLLIIFLLLMRFNGKNMLRFIKYFRSTKVVESDGSISLNSIEMAEVVSPMSPLPPGEVIRLDENDFPKKKNSIKSLFYLYPSYEYSKKRRLIFMCTLSMLFAIGTTIMFIVISVESNKSMNNFYKTLDEIEDITNSLNYNFINFKETSKSSMKYYLMSLGMSENKANDFINNDSFDPDDFMDIVKDLIKSGIIDRIFGMELIRQFEEAHTRKNSFEYIELPKQNYNIFNPIKKIKIKNPLKKINKIQKKSLDICLSTKMTTLGANVTIVAGTSVLMKDQVKPLVSFVSNSNDVVTNLHLDIWIPLVYSILAVLSLVYVFILLYSQYKRWDYGLKLSIVFSVLMFYFLCTASALVLFIFTLSSDICMDPLNFVINNMKNNKIVEDTIRYLTKCFGNPPMIMTAIETGIDTVSGMEIASNQLSTNDCAGVESMVELSDELDQLNIYSQNIKEDLNCIRLRNIWEDLLYKNLCTDVQNIFFITWICTLVSGFLIFCLLLDIIITNYDDLITLKESKKDIPYYFETSMYNLEIDKRSDNSDANNNVKEDSGPLTIKVDDYEEELEEDMEEIIVEIYDDNKHALKSPPPLDL